MDEKLDILTLKELADIEEALRRVFAAARRGVMAQALGIDVPESAPEASPTKLPE